jgi:hypothetical protein
LFTYTGAAVWVAIPTSGGYLLPVTPFLLALLLENLAGQQATARGHPRTLFVPAALVAIACNAVWIKTSTCFARQQERSAFIQERLEAVSAVLPSGGTLVSVDLTLQTVAGRFAHGKEVKELRLALFLLESRGRGQPPEALEKVIAERIGILDEAARQGRWAFDRPTQKGMPSGAGVAFAARYRAGPTVRYADSELTRLDLD